MTVDDRDLDIAVDPTPSIYEELHTDREPTKISHCYRHGGRVVELVYRKEQQRLDVDCDLLYQYPWVIDRQVVDPLQFDTPQLATFLEKAIGLYTDIKSWELKTGLPCLIVDPEAGVVVRDLRGNIVETLVPPAEGVDPA